MWIGTNVLRDDIYSLFNIIENSQLHHNEFQAIWLLKEC